MMKLSARWNRWMMAAGVAGAWLFPVLTLAEEHEHGAGFGLWELIAPMGATTLSLVIATFILGLVQRRNFAKLHKWHKRLAYLTVASALTHATLVFIFH